ncbi:DUF7925 domain-containing protein [Almyronema epifaneia]|uniref:DUF7925 domain-containing protein n=1 Tax=Almyronema epifaneia S1 TaxID=2991925 RepID=A0ABW6IIF7_9CYAN
MTKTRWKKYRPLIATALAIGGTLQMVGAVLADGTAAGTSISNTATATYNDPNDPGSTLTTTSNTVTVEVAEVAGITVQAAGVDDVNGNTVDRGDVLYYNYVITNVGNDTTSFRIPNSADITGPGVISGPVEVDQGGGFTAISGGSLDTGAVPPGGTVQVRVPVTVDSNANPNDIITVQLGNTPGNGQNQLFNTDGGDVYTVDLANGTAGEVDGAPANGVREASDAQQITVGNASLTVPLVKLEKAISEQIPGDPSIITDDQVTYELSFEVQDTAPIGSPVSPGPLYSLPLSVDGGTANYVLVSDAVPAGTALTGTPAAPAGWQVVYTAEATSTLASSARWYTTPAAALSGTGATANITRIGFVRQVASIAPGTTVQPFRFTVVTSGVTSGDNVANLAQVFGYSEAANPGDPVDPNKVVADESGDQQPSNLKDGEDGVEPTDFDPPSDGYIDDATDLTNTGEDTGKNNTGSGDGGEAIVLQFNDPVQASLLNGPLDEPDAIGPTSDEDDFTNKSAFVPSASSVPGSTYNPSPVNFSNSVQNNGTDPGDITLVPTPPATATDLPDGTQVTIVGPNGSTATYEWDQANGVFTGLGGGPAPAPITVVNVPAGQEVDYGVEVDLPANTPLSTDIERGFPVPITATLTNAGGSASNTTIDRVYTGFLQLVKLSRILQGDGPAVGAGQGSFDSTPAVDPDGAGPLPAIDPNSAVADVPRTPQPGNIIEYRITYTNISEQQSGSGNVVLTADNVIITEDGTGANGNNWALDQDANGVIDTSNVVNTANDSRGGGIGFFSGASGSTAAADQSGTTQTSDITKYVDTISGVVGPQQSGNFTFQRRLN